MKNLLKNIKFQFGFYSIDAWNNPNLLDKISWYLTKYIKIIPALHFEFFNHYKDGSKAVKYHEIGISFFKWYWVIEKIYPRGTRIIPFWTITQHIGNNSKILLDTYKNKF